MAAAAIPSPSPAERLAGLIDGLCKAVAAHGVRGLLTAPLILLLWARLSRMAQRARRLAARMAAGAPLSIPRGKSAPRSTPSRPYTRLPRGVLWLVKAVPATSFGAAQLQFLLDDPEMAAIADSPPMRRLLRPLCRMLGVQPPPVTKPAPPPAAAPQPLLGAGTLSRPPEPCPATPAALGPPASPSTPPSAA